MTTAYPWAAELAATSTTPGLSQLWQVWATDAKVLEAMELLDKQGLDLTPEQIIRRMGEDWKARAGEIAAAQSTGATQQQIVTAREKLAEIDDQSMEAVHDYAAALDKYARAHAAYKKERAKKYLAVKAEYAARGDKLTNGEADMLADADEEVARLYMESEIGEGLVKAARALLDHLDRSFQHHRSLFVRQEEVDRR